MTYPREIGNQNCWPLRLRDVPGQLGRELQSVAHDWIVIRHKEGEEYVPVDDIHVYGPFPSMVRLEAMLTNEHGQIGKVEERQITREVAEEHVFSHYLLNANFLVASEDASRKDDGRNGRVDLQVA